MWPNPQFPVDLVTFTEEILNGKLHSLCNVMRRREEAWFNNHLLNRFDFAVCWNCLFKCLKYRCCGETYTSNTVLDSHCYSSYSSLSIRKYLNGSFMHEDFRGASCLRRKNNILIGKLTNKSMLWISAAWDIWFLFRGL